MTAVIKEVRGRRIWDSRGWPTIEAEIISSSGKIGRGVAPTGASRGSKEAVELRDGGSRLGGRDVKQALGLIQSEISPRLEGMPLFDIRAIDGALQELDGTNAKQRLGGNTTVAVSLAALNASANESNLPLWRHVSNLLNVEPCIPLPEIQIFGGGAHADYRTQVQDFMVMVPGAESYSEAIEVTAEIYHAAGTIMRQRGKLAGVADEGGWWPQFSSSEEALETLMAAIELAGEKPGERTVISLDIAASEFGERGKYNVAHNCSCMDSGEWIDILGSWIDTYPIASIEDPLAEDDSAGMIEFTRRFGNRIQIVGDDYLVTRSDLISSAVDDRACNSALIKVNQVGTVTEALDAFETARNAGWGTIFSARSGETEDISLSHLATGTACGQLKVGSFSRSERMSKWNECLRLEEQVGVSSFWSGRIRLLS